MGEETVIHDRIRKLGGGGFETKLLRTYAGHEQAELWRMLTDSSRLPEGIAAGAIELRKGGKVHMDSQDSGIVIDSEVRAFDPPRLLAYSWSSGDQPLRPMRSELDDVEDGTRLTLTVGTPTGEDPEKACAGFEGHLEMLAAALEGVPIKLPFDLYKKARAEYSAQLAGERKR